MPKKEVMRKRPAQGRSKHTVDIILQASEQLLVRKGEQGLTTTSVAEYAGVSVGTLYQYFSDRDALLLAIAYRQRDRLIERLSKMLTESDIQKSADLVRAFVHVLIESFIKRRGARRQFELLIQLKTVAKKPFSILDELTQGIIIQWGKHVLKEEIKRNEIQIYVLTRALVGVLQSAAMENVDFLDSQEFEDSLCELIYALSPFNVTRI